MKEFRFKLLGPGEKLCHFDESEMVIKTPDGSYKIYRLDGFSDGKPIFYKNPNIVQVLDLNEITCSVLCLKLGDEYRIYRTDSSAEVGVVIDKSFVLIVKSGIGKLEVYDTESDITITLPAKEAM